MRIVIYDDESLEPITVVKIPGFTERDIEAHGRRYRLLLPHDPLTIQNVVDRPLLHIPTVDIWFERFVRDRQTSWFAFTRATELAMLLTPDWLPGQRRAVDYLQDQNDRLTQMLIASLAM